MNRPTIAPLLLLGLALSVARTAAAGPQDDPPQTRLEPISVHAPRPVLKHERGDRVWQNVQAAHVRYDDLDLSRNEDRLALERRVAEAADQVCGDLSRLYPDATPGRSECARRAFDDAMVEVDRIADEHARMAALDGERDGD